MKNIRNLIKEYFTLSEKEANGFIILCICMLFVLAFPWAHSHYLDLQEDKAPLSQTSYFSQIVEAHDKAEKFYAVDQPSVNIESFDPNKIEPEKLAALGLDKKIAERIARYRSKGGKFKIKSDLLKIYGFPEKFYKKIESYILLPDKLPVLKVEQTRTKNKEKFITSIDLNKVKAEELIKIKGIGTVLSERIIKFRDRLGGFVSKDQIKEVYGLDSTVINELQRIGIIDSLFNPKKLSVKNATIEEFSAHPYINRKAANILVNYRTEHGTYHNSEDILKSKAFKKEELVKILPYLEF